MFSPAIATIGAVAGSAALGFWLALVHPRFGPQTMRSALVACACALAALEIVKLSTAALAASTDVAVTLLCLVVPGFGFAFWSGAVLIRAFAAGPARTGG